MGWNTSDIPPLHGRIAVVTGANSGLGLESSRALAAAGATVVMTARDRAKGERARDEVAAAASGEPPQLVEMDLASLASIASAAESIAADHPVIDILLNNAGVMAISERSTEDGFEMQLGVNHLGHYALTAHLLTPLLRAAAARVVTVTSTARYNGRKLRLDNPHLRGTYTPPKAYYQAKLANYHFALGLHRRFADAGVTAASLAADPGISNTNLQAVSVAESDNGTWQRFFHWLATRMGSTPAAGARAQLRAATDPAARSGQLVAPLFITNGPPVRHPVLRRMGLAHAIDRMWEVSARETGITLDVAAALDAVQAQNATTQAGT